MSAITKEFTKEQLIEKLKHRISVASEFPESEKAQIDLEIARIALSSLELERGIIRRFDLDMSGCDSCGQDCGADMVEDLGGEYVLWDEVLPYLYSYGEYIATPAPVSVPEVVGWEDVPEEITEDDIALASAWAHGFNQCRAAMIQCADGSIAHEGKNHPEDKLGMVDHFGGSNNMVEPVTDNTNQQFESLSRGDK